MSILDANGRLHGGDGRFAEQHRDESGVPLVKPAPLVTGRPVSPLLAAGLPSWPEHLPEPTFKVGFTDDGEIATQILTGDRVATFWRGWRTDMADTEEWSTANGEFDAVYLYGKALQARIKDAVQDSLDAPAGRMFLSHVEDRAQTGHASAVADLLQLADESGLAVSYQGRGSFEDHLGRRLTEEEWARVRPELHDLDEWQSAPGSLSYAEISVWRSRVLTRAGVGTD